jgi:UDP-N-acetylglucosamine transferase subunit ALG13
MSRRVDALLVTEPGGHLLEMWAMRDVVPRARRAWCTIAGPDVRSLLRDEDVTVCHGPTCRSVPNLLRNLADAARIIRARRPRVILCTGSGITVPFAWAGRALGARVLYVECGGRVDGPSLSCRLLGPAAHRVYVQWPELVARVPRAQCFGHLPWEGAPRAAPPRPGVPRTLVTVGTSRVFRFDRLVATAEAIGGHIVVQRGPSRLRPGAATVVDYMSFDDLNAEMAAADAVVTHAGIGSVLLAITHGHRPVVMARRPELGEGVDRHQLEFARRLHEQGLAVVIDEPGDVGAALASIRPVALAGAARPQPNELLSHLRVEVRACVTS